MATDEEWERITHAHLWGAEDLESKPLEASSPNGEGGSFAFWTKECPDFLERELHRKHGYGRSYMTVYQTRDADKVLVVDGEPWDLIAENQATVERPCPFHPEHDPAEGAIPRDEHGNCRYCDAKEGKEHGYMYIGEEWLETVYVKRRMLMGVEVQFDVEANREASESLPDRLSHVERLLTRAIEQVRSLANYTGDEHPDEFTIRDENGNSVGSLDLTWSD